MHRIFLCSILFLLSGVVWAAQPELPRPVTQEQATRIETDQKNGVVRIMVDNQEVARFDARGLHVRKDVEYGGNLADIGEVNYNKETRASRAP